MKKFNFFTLLFVLQIFILPQIHYAQPGQKYTDQWNDPYIQQRIKNGIEQNRMGNFKLQFEDPDKNIIKNVSIEIKQVSHDFYFGANGFMVKGFKNEKEDALFEEYFTYLFNFVTIPFYWPELEPEEGNLRFGKDSEYIYRRPAPDVLLEFCEKYNITPKGHTLVWDNPRWSLPDWLPQDEKIMEQKISKRIDQIAERYGHDIQIWDIANEVTDRHPHIIMPRDFTYKAFQESERVFPNSNVFTLNFTTNIFKRSNRREYNADYLLIENMLLRNAKVDAIGMQYHNFNEEEYWKILDGKVFTPESLFSTLDLYSDFNLPIHITEITIAALSEKGPEYQAIMTENLYKLWFSHKNVEAIIWWNMLDGTAAPARVTANGSVVPGEDKWKGGLMNRDFTKKPAYEVLDRLINSEWKTNLSVKTKSGETSFSCFYGNYEIVIRANGKTYTKTLNFSKKASRKQVIVLY